MGLFDALTKKITVDITPQPIQQIQPQAPQYTLLPVESVQIHKAPIVPGNINAIKTDCYALHFETTGTFALGDPAKPTTSMITAIKCARFKNMQMVDYFCTFINPQRPIPQAASNASGITDQMVFNAPTIAQAFPFFINYFKDALNGTIVLCYNGEFNGDFLKITMRRQMLPGEVRIFDVMKLADKKLRMSGYPTMKQAMKAMNIKDRELNNDIHKCSVTAALAFSLVDVPDNSVEV